jgi:hypothetical protein
LATYVIHEKFHQVIGVNRVNQGQSFSIISKMSSIGTLYTVPYQTKGKIVRIAQPPDKRHSPTQLFDIYQIKAAAALGGIILDAPESYVHMEDNKKPEFLSKFPHGKIPALETKDGFLLFEGVAISKYGESYHVVQLFFSERVPSHRVMRFYIFFQLSLS